MKYINNLSGEIIFEGTDLRGADLKYADLRYTNLKHTDLSNADLRYASLSDANLNYADLSAADLRYANLSNADLRYSSLSNANLEDANLRCCIGNNDEIKTIQTGTWTIVYTNDQMVIGCEQYPIVDWFNFDDDKIKSFGINVFVFWNKWKSILKEILNKAL